jgi:hypothetical protein
MRLVFHQDWPDDVRNILGFSASVRTAKAVIERLDNAPGALQPNAIGRWVFATPLRTPTYVSREMLYQYLKVAPAA